MIQSHETCHHRDGTIDFDFYRTQANAMRAHVLRDGIIKLGAAFRSTPTKVGALVVAFLAAAAPLRVRSVKPSPSSNPTR